MRSRERGAAMVESLLALAFLIPAAGALIQLSLLNFEAVRVQELAREGARHLHRSQVGSGGVDLKAYVRGLYGRGALELNPGDLRIWQSKANPELGITSAGANPVFLWLLRMALENLGAWRVHVEYEGTRQGLLRFLGPRKLSAEAVVITGNMRMALW